MVLIHPKGAIKSLEEALAHDNWIWIASREFHNCHETKLVGQLSISELRDFNVFKLNGYNDWFVFANEVDAKRQMAVDI